MRNNKQKKQEREQEVCGERIKRQKENEKNNYTKCSSYSSILNLSQIIKTFDFSNIKFDYSSYSKIYAKYHFFVVVWFIN